jgi:hypothetical protein
VGCRFAEITGDAESNNSNALNHSTCLSFPWAGGQRDPLLRLCRTITSRSSALVNLTSGTRLSGSRYLCRKTLPSVDSRSHLTFTACLACRRKQTASRHLPFSLKRRAAHPRNWRERRQPGRKSKTQKRSILTGRNFGRATPNKRALLAKCERLTMRLQSTATCCRFKLFHLIRN